MSDVAPNHGINPNRLGGTYGSGSSEYKKGLTNKQKAVMAIAGVGLTLAAAGVGANVMAKSAEVVTPTNTEAPANPAETPAATETTPAETEKSHEELVAELEIPAGLGTEALANILVADRETQWSNAGTYTPADANAFKEEWLAYNGTAEDFLSMKCEENASIFAEAMMAPGWESDESLVKHVDGRTRFNYYVLNDYMHTAWNGDEHPENVEGYRTWFTVDSATETTNSDGDRVLTIEYTQRSNSDMNSCDPLDTSIDNDTAIYILRNVDGAEKIVSYQFIEQH